MTYDFFFYSLTKVLNFVLWELFLYTLYKASYSYKLG